jgi:hypothetical protein
MGSKRSKKPFNAGRKISQIEHSRRKHVHVRVILPSVNFLFSFSLSYAYRGANNLQFLFSRDMNVFRGKKISYYSCVALICVLAQQSLVFSAFDIGSDTAQRGEVVHVHMLAELLCYPDTGTAPDSTSEELPNTPSGTEEDRNESEKNEAKIVNDFASHLLNTMRAAACTECDCRLTTAFCVIFTPPPELS